MTDNLRMLRVFGLVLAVFNYKIFLVATTNPEHEIY